MMEFSRMWLFYAAMIGVPILMFLIAILSYFTVFDPLKYLLGILLGIGSLIYGALGFREVFIHG